MVQSLVFHDGLANENSWITLSSDRGLKNIQYTYDNLAKTSYDYSYMYAQCTSLAMYHTNNAHGIIVDNKDFTQLLW